MIFATGSTKARTRLYRIGISNHLEEIQEDFEIFGLVRENWQPFQKQIEFEAFLGAFQNVAKVANLQQVHFSLKTLFQRLATFNPVRHFEMHPHF